MGDGRLLAAGLLPLLWLVPLVRIARAWRGTSLAGALFWLGLAWLYWTALPVAVYFAPDLARPLFYLGMVTAACAFVAVLGARSPGLVAWSVFVVGGLAATLAMPLLEQNAGSPAWRLDEPRSLFLALILVVALLDYLPTRHGFAAIVMVGSLGWLLYGLHFGLPPKLKADILLGVHLGVALAAWLGWSRGHGRGPFGAPDPLWLAFRDRYGAVWGLRALEQTNQALKHADWNVRLTWFGFSPYEGGGAIPNQEDVLRKLQAVLAKFMG